jgi:hypothetical protein
MRNLLGIPGGITPSASLPVAEVPSVMRSSPSLPSAHATSVTPIAAAPVASRPAARRLPPVADMIRASRNPRIGPGETIADYVDKKLAEALGNPLVAKAAARPIAKGKSKPAPPEPAAADDDDDDSLNSAYRQLQEVLQILKSMGASDDDEGEQEANALFARGLKAAAFRKIMAVTSRLSARTAKEAQRLSMTPHARMALSFDEPPAVAALKAALSPRVAPIPSAAPATEPLARFRQIETEIAALDKEQRRRFTNEGQAKHSALRREQAALRSKLRP